MLLNGKTALQTIVKKAIEELSIVRTKKDAISKWDAFRTQLIQCKNVHNQPISDYTIRKAVSDIRKGIKANLDLSKKTHVSRANWLLHEQIKGIDGTYKAALGIVVSGAEIAARNQAAKKTSVTRKVASVNSLRNYKSYISICESLLTSFDWKEVATGILALTGRRTVEIMKTGSLSKSRGMYLNFDGQAKSKDGKPYRIPTLVSPSKLVKALARLRRLKDVSGLDNEQVNQICHVPIERACKKHLKPFSSSKITAHDLRKIYTCICLETRLTNNSDIRDDNGDIITNQRLYIKAILGHQETETGMHYESWVLL